MSAKTTARQGGRVRRRARRDPGRPGKGGRRLVGASNPLQDLKGQHTRLRANVSNLQGSQCLLLALTVLGALSLSG